jgi:hypothetical protein
VPRVRYKAILEDAVSAPADRDRAFNPAPMRGAEALAALKA